MNEKKMIETERLENLLNKVKLNGVHIDLSIIQKEIICSAFSRLHCVLYHAPRAIGKTLAIAILLKINNELLKEPLPFKLSSNMVNHDIDYIEDLMKTITFDVKKGYKLNINTLYKCIIVDDDFEFLNDGEYLRNLSDKKYVDTKYVGVSTYNRYLKDDLKRIINAFPIVNMDDPSSYIQMPNIRVIRQGTEIFNGGEIDDLCALLNNDEELLRSEVFLSPIFRK